MWKTLKRLLLHRLLHQRVLSQRVLNQRALLQRVLLQRVLLLRVLLQRVLLLRVLLQRALPKNLLQQEHTHILQNKRKKKKDQPYQIQNLMRKTQEVKMIVINMKINPMAQKAMQINKRVLNTKAMGIKRMSVHTLLILKIQKQIRRCLKMKTNFCSSHLRITDLNTK
jgi:hypothetical protein